MLLDKEANITLSHSHLWMYKGSYCVVKLGRQYP